MAAVVVERIWRTTTADEIESELADVWRAVGQREQVAHAVMSNLVIFRDCESIADLWTGARATDLPIDEVAALHPSRVIIVSRAWAPGGSATEIAAAVGVAIYGPPQTRYGVDRIAIRSSCADASLPSIVRRLIRGDIPTSIWWADDLVSGLPEPLVTVGRQLVFDSRRWSNVKRCAAALTTALDNPRLDLADLNWARLAPVRRAFVHAGDQLSAEELGYANVRITYRPGEEALAWLLAAWLSTRIGWPAATWPQIEPFPHPDDELIIVEVGRSGEPTRMVLSTHQLVVKQRGWPEYRTAIRVRSDAETMAEELKALLPDAGLRETLRALGRVSAATSP